MSKVIEVKPFKDWVRAWRLGNRWTLREAAEILGVSQQVLSHWEMGDNMPRGVTLQKVMKALKIAIEEIDFGN